MNHNPKLALIDSDGDERFAAIINGTYQIGKGRKRTPAISNPSHALFSSKVRMDASSARMAANPAC